MSNNARTFRLYIRTSPEGLLVRVARQFTSFGQAWRHARTLSGVLNAELRQTTPSGGERLLDEFEFESESTNGQLVRTYTGEAL